MTLYIMLMGVEPSAVIDDTKVDLKALIKYTKMVHKTYL